MTFRMSTGKMIGLLIIKIRSSVCSDILRQIADIAIDTNLVFLKIMTRCIV